LPGDHDRSGIFRQVGPGGKVAGEHPAKICGRINLSDPVDTTRKRVIGHCILKIEYLWKSLRSIILSTGLY